MWHVVTSGYRLARTDDGQVLVITEGGAPQTEIVVEFAEFTETIPKEYELFQPFSDGAVALYTGHFYATPVGPAYADTAQSIRTIRLTPPAGTHAVVRGRVHDGPLSWTDPHGDGTYIYLGTATPIETPDLIAVVDPGMPEWLAQRLHARLPELFATYAARFGVSLPWKPVVLYSFDDADVSGYSSSGGTLTGLIQMTLTGSAWRRASAAAEEHVFQLLAHEAVHLWNGQLVGNPGDGGSWMHEGAANAMAHDLLLEFRVIDAERHRAIREEAINECFVALGDGPVNLAHRRGAFGVFYDCGELIALWTEAAVRQVDSAADLFAFWRDLVAAARAGEGHYDEDLYFATLATRGVGELVREQMRTFVSMPGAVEVAVRGLRAAGVGIEPGTGTPPRSFQHELVRRAIAHLMTQACGQMSFRAGDPVVTDSVPGCAPFARSLRVYGIEGADVGEEGAAIYDHVAARCAASQPVTFEGEDGGVIGSVPCDRRLPARPPWYELHR